MNTSRNAQQAAVTLLVEETVEAKLRAKEPFTALDISNALKARRFPVRHGEVTAVVRAIYASGAMGYYDYDRRLIDVLADRGTKRVQTFLYLHKDSTEREYGTRDQDALPPVPDSLARSLDDAVPAGNPQSPLQAAYQNTARRSPRASSRSTAPRSRRDGALPIPRALVAQAGWHIGEMLTLSLGATATGFVLEPAQPSSQGAATVRVWADLRVRICKTKLRLTALTDPAGVRFGVNGGTLQVETPTL